MSNHIKYGFQGHLSPEFPSQIVIDVTEFCNLSCIHCPQNDFVKSKAFGGHHLDKDLHKKLIDEVAEDGSGNCRYLRYTGEGETLLHPQFIEMVSYAKSRLSIAINVTTNGTILTDDKSISLLNIGVDVIDISIDAYSPETYSAIRRKGNLEVTRHNVLNLIERVREGSFGTKVVVSYVEQPLNTHETALFDKFWKDAGAHQVVIRRLHSAGGAKDEIAASMKGRNSLARRPCVYPWERLVLKPNGYVTYCPADWKGMARIAHFKDTSIKDIWTGDYMRRLRDAHITNDFSCFSFCDQCPDWIETRWPHEGRGYAAMMMEINT